MKTLALMLIVAVGVVGCKSNTAVKTSSGISAESSSSTAAHFGSATIERRFDTQGNMVNQRITLNTPAQIAELESYFPSVGQRQRGQASGGWQPSVIIRFKRTSAPDVRVRTNYEVWSEGIGDWPLRPGFKNYLERLFKQQGG